MNYLNGRLEAERNHTAYESSGADCRDCLSPVADVDEDFCAKCGEPICLDCRFLSGDESLCRKCFADSEQAVIECQRKIKVAGAIRHFAELRASLDAAEAA